MWDPESQVKKGGLIYLSFAAERERKIGTRNSPLGLAWRSSSVNWTVSMVMRL